MSALLRSMLFVPADRPAMVQKALASQADAVIVDLEDAVAVAHKPMARAQLAEALPDTRQRPVYIRVNGPTTPWCLADLTEVAALGVDGVLIPKVESPADVHAVEWALGQLEDHHHTALAVILILETGAGIARAAAIMAAAQRARRVNFGAGDTAQDLTLEIGADEAEITTYRALVVAQSRAQGFFPPLDSVFADFRDLDGLRASCQRARRMGFAGKLCIHPQQIAIINEVFTPSDRAVEAAQRIVSAFAEAEAQGTGAIEVDGKLVDAPIVEQARQLIALREQIDKRNRA